MPAMTLAEPPAQKRRLALFLDGTTDTSQGNTNVWRARSLCAAKGTDGIEQKVFYAAHDLAELRADADGDVFGYGIARREKVAGGAGRMRALPEEARWCRWPGLRRLRPSALIRLAPRATFSHCAGEGEPRP